MLSSWVRHADWPTIRRVFFKWATAYCVTVICFSCVYGLLSRFEERRAFLVVAEESVLRSLINQLGTGSLEDNLKLPMAMRWTGQMQTVIALVVNGFFVAGLVVALQRRKAPLQMPTVVANGDGAMPPRRLWLRLANVSSIKLYRCSVGMRLIIPRSAWLTPLPAGAASDAASCRVCLEHHSIDVFPAHSIRRLDLRNEAVGGRRDVTALVIEQTYTDEELPFSLNIRDLLTLAGQQNVTLQVVVTGQYTDTDQTFLFVHDYKLTDILDNATFIDMPDDPATAQERFANLKRLDASLSRIRHL